MVEVEMCDDDVSNVFSPESELFDLPCRGLGHAQRWSEKMASRTQPPRILNVIQAVSRVDKNEASVSLDQ
jgi:hypothetical protein